MIIYDNADDLGLLKSLLPDKHALGHVLLTTRAKQDSNEFAMLGFDVKKDIVSISTLPQGTAETLLLRVAGHDEDVEKQEKEKQTQRKECLLSLHSHPTKAIAFEATRRLCKQISRPEAIKPVCSSQLRARSIRPREDRTVA